MQPDICIKCKAMALDHLRRNLVHVKDLENNQILIERYEPLGLFLNVSIQKSKIVLEKKIKIKEKIFRISDLNIDLIKRDQGTGYHIPEGVLLLYGDIAHQFKHLNNQVIDSRHVVPLILKHYGLNKPDYMLDI